MLIWLYASIDVNESYSLNKQNIICHIRPITICDSKQKYYMECDYKNNNFDSNGNPVLCILLNSSWAYNTEITTKQNLRIHFEHGIFDCCCCCYCCCFFLFCSTFIWEIFNEYCLFCIHILQLSVSTHHWLQQTQKIRRSFKQKK